MFAVNVFTFAIVLYYSFLIKAPQTDLSHACLDGGSNEKVFYVGLSLMDENQFCSVSLIILF